VTYHSSPNVLLPLKRLYDIEKPVKDVEALVQTDISVNKALEFAVDLYRHNISAVRAVVFDDLLKWINVRDCFEAPVLTLCPDEEQLEEIISQSRLLENEVGDILIHLESLEGINSELLPIISSPLEEAVRWDARVASVDISVHQLDNCTADIEKIRPERIVVV